MSPINEESIIKIMNIIKFLLMFISKINEKNKLADSKHRLEGTIGLINNLYDII